MIVFVVVVALLIVIAAVWTYMRKRQSDQLRERFGPEYEHTVQTYGDRQAAEEQLRARQERMAKRDIQPLAPADSTRFVEAWRSAQARFVDAPAAAIGEADRLVAEVMRTRGYPVGDFEQRAADVSVDHPHVVEHYRAAHEIAQRNARGEADTEDLRQAMVHYRALFEELLETASIPEPAMAREKNVPAGEEQDRARERAEQDAGEREARKVESERKAA
jgi:hypothetical protein